MLLGQGAWFGVGVGEGAWWLSPGLPLWGLAQAQSVQPAWPGILLIVWAAVALTWLTAWFLTGKLRQRRDELTLLLANQSRRLADRTEELKAVCDILRALNHQRADAAEFALTRMIDLIPDLTRGGLLVRGPKDRRFKIVAHTGYGDFRFKRLEFTFEEIMSQYAEGTEQLSEGVFLVRCPDLIDTDLPRATCMVALVLEVRGRLRGLLVLDHEIDIGMIGESHLERLKRFRIYAGDVVAGLRIDNEERRKENP